jgi:cell division septation protein DedD
MPTMITFRAGGAVLVAVLLTVAGCSAEQQDWRAAEAAGTSEAYQRFMEQHPDSELAGKARERVGEFVEDRDWSQAAKLATADAYRSFLAAHPRGRWSQEARIRIESFALGSIPLMAPQTPGQTAGPATGVKLLRLASAAPSIPAGALPASPAPAAVAAPAVLPAPQPPLPATAATVATGYAVQLGAFGSQASATREWQRLEARFASVLAGLSPQLVAAGSTSAPIYRLQAAARGEAQARAICDSLKAQSQPCVPVLPHWR